MASFAKNFSLIFLFALLSSLQIHARDGQFFNKVPSNNGEKETQSVVPNKEQEPNFMPENENGAYGLYGHDSVSTPSTTNTNSPNVNNLPNSKYLPKNYNPVSYITVAEDNTNENNFNNDNDNNKNNNNEFATKQTTDQFYSSPTNYRSSNNNNNQFYSAPTNYRSRNNNNQQQYYHGVSDFSTKNHYDNQQQQQFYSGDSFYSNNQQYNNINNNNEDINEDINEEEEYDNAANSYYNNNNNEQQQGFTETRLSGKSYSTNPTNYGNNYNNYNNQEQTYSNNYNSYNNGNGNYKVHQQQGMSDTRFLGKGKFYYDIKAEKHARDPYENAKEFAAMNHQYNNRNTYGNNEYNNDFENEVFQHEDNMPWLFQQLKKKKVITIVSQNKYYVFQLWLMLAFYFSLSKLYFIRENVN